ncbi:MAG TPA: hypothetical protein VGK36_11375 [Candidatus Angelobacter sp.]|jgi:hypothetical protein
MTIKFSWQIFSFPFAVRALKNMYSCYANPALLLVTYAEVGCFPRAKLKLSGNPMHLKRFLDGNPPSAYLIWLLGESPFL